MPLIRKSYKHPIKNDEEDVIMTVDIGDEQGPGPLTVISKNASDEGDSIKLNLGKGGTLRNTTTNITGPVNISNGNSEFASLDISLTNTSMSAQPSGKTNGDSTATFIIKIKHV